jgi:tight adherence protein B
MMSNLPIMIMAAGLLGTLALAWFALAGPSPAKVQARRLQTVRERHSHSTEVAKEAHMKRLLTTRNTAVDSFAQRFIPNPALLRLRLQRTGKNWSLGKYVAACAIIAALFALFLIGKGFPLLLGLIISIGAGIGLPHFAVGFLIKRRVTQFTTRFPDAIELMVRGLRSGLPITETLGIVAREVQGPVAVEFQIVVDRMKIGQTMEAALQEIADRLGTAEFQFFVITLGIQRETGGNLAETLANLADVLRKRSAMKLKIRAMSSEAKASAMILGALPFVVFGLIWMVNSGYLANFFVDQRLIVAGLGGMVWMSIGIFVMAKMVNFEI